MLIVLGNNVRKNNISNPISNLTYPTHLAW